MHRIDAKPVGHCCISQRASVIKAIMPQLVGNCESLTFRDVCGVDVYFSIFFVKITRLGTQIINTFNIKSQAASEIFGRNWNVEVPILIQKGASRIYSSCHFEILVKVRVLSLVLGRKSHFRSPKRLKGAAPSTCLGAALLQIAPRVYRSPVKLSKVLKVYTRQM